MDDKRLNLENLKRRLLGLSDPENRPDNFVLPQIASVEISLRDILIAVLGLSKDISTAKLKKEVNKALDAEREKR